MPSTVPSLRHRVVPVEYARERGGILTVMSGQERTGDWEMPRHFRVACVFGSTELDFREARIPEGESVIEVFALFASVEMIFPPGVTLDVDGGAFVGEFSVHTDPTVFPPPGSPIIRIVGTAYVSSVEAHVRYAGERPRDAKKRIRSARSANVSSRRGAIRP